MVNPSSEMCHVLPSSGWARNPERSLTGEKGVCGVTEGGQRFLKDLFTGVSVEGFVRCPSPLLTFSEFGSLPWS